MGLEFEHLPEDAIVAVLEIMSSHRHVAGLVLSYLDHGMIDEWDCHLTDGITTYGMGDSELQVAARSGLSLARYHRDKEQE